MKSKKEKLPKKKAQTKVWKKQDVTQGIFFRKLLFLSEATKSSNSSTDVNSKLNHTFIELPNKIKFQELKKINERFYSG